MISYIVVDNCVTCRRPVLVPTFCTGEVEFTNTCTCVPGTKKRKTKFTKLVEKLKQEIVFQQPTPSNVSLALGVVFGQMQAALLANNRVKLRRSLAEISALAWQFGEYVSEDK